MPENQTIYSVGHSSHPLDLFLSLLEKHEIRVLADVRSHPFSGYSPQFDRPLLEKSLKDRNIRYVFLGEELGGRPDDEDFYDQKGKVYYGKVAKTKLFRQGIERLKKGLSQFRVAMLCSEENPTECHRRLLVGRVLGEEGVDVVHIRGDNRLQTEAEVAAADPREVKRRQIGLFEEIEEDQWKSIPSVLQKKRPNDSSNY